MAENIYSSIYSGSEIDTAVGKVSILEEQVETINTTITNNVQPSINTINDNMANINKNITNISDELAKKANTNYVDQSITSIQSIASATQDEVKILNQTITTKANITYVNNQVSSVKNDYQNADTEITNSISTLRQELLGEDDIIREQIDTIQMHVGTNQESIINLQKQISTLDGTVSGNNNTTTGTISTIQNDIITLKNNKANAAETAEALALKLDIAVFNNYKSTIEGIIDTKANASEVNTSVSTIDDQIVALNERLVVVETIAGVNVPENTITLTNLNERITTLESIIQDTDTGIMAKLLLLENQLRSLESRLDILENTAPV